MEDALLAVNDDASSAKTGSSVGTQRKMTTWRATTTVFTLICYPFGVPYCFGQMGWYFGTFFLLFSTWINIEAGVALGEICAENESLSTFPAVVGGAFGSAAATWTLYVQYGSYWLTNVYNFVITAEYWGEAGVASWCDVRWMLVTFFLVVPLIQLPDYHAMAWPATVCNVVTIGCAFVIFYVAFQQGGPRGDVEYGSVSFASASRGATSLAFVLGGAGVFPELCAEMEKPRELGTAVKGAFVPIVALYAGCGAVGFWLFGSAASGDAIRNFPPDLAVTRATAFLSAASFVVTTVENNLFMVMGLERGALDRYPSLRRVPPRFFRAVLRTTFLGSEILVAAALRGAGAGDMQALAGAVSGPALCYVLPFAVHLKVFAGTHSAFRKASFLGFCAVGIALFGFGMYFSIATVAEAASSYQLFGGACRLSAERD